jgi:hypothetical protein
MRGLNSGRLQFGVYEYDAASGELSKRGIKIRIQDQPLKVLAALLERWRDRQPRRDPAKDLAG